ncbi:hypothetical protein D0T53_03950 [Dysgonomonas sp. 216]|uniref:glycosyltransferase family 2 protein n=1 Tax=Dysgonomonas sp. 216 TaxID=2302934 RepID=UPI0013D24755|nr:glycosyltransferase family 2 protein [Dysgonomonas sp. 216]NDW18070.1 hypothetical protein [Dysgonomonas sp. 216]
MKKIAILIRVYNRIEDLKYNLQIIVNTWRRFDYHIIVVSNGYNDGYVIDDESAKLIDDLVVIENNAGHRKGNSQLLLEGIKHIPSDCEYTIILEADTWMYKDLLIRDYIDDMKSDKNIMWASADWYDKQYGMATDFAIIRTQYIQENPKLFDFELYPECYIANYLRDTNADYIYITENMPVHVPSYVFIYPYVNNRKEKRFYVFPKARMVTHHIEFLRKGMAQKKRYFNIVAKTNYFEDTKVYMKKWKRYKMKFWIGLSKLFIKKSWFCKKVYKNLD